MYTYFLIIFLCTYNYGNIYSNTIYWPKKVKKTRREFSKFYSFKQWICTGSVRRALARLRGSWRSAGVWAGPAASWGTPWCRWPWPLSSWSRWSWPSGGILDGTWSAWCARCVRWCAWGWSFLCVIRINL